MKVQKTQLTNLQLPKPVYLMANPVYHLQMHHRQNQYLHARLDTCTDVNLMPVAVYQLMFKDPCLKKLTPSTLKIETYMNDVMKIIGSCQFYLLHTENKKLVQVIFLCGQGKWECSIVMQNNHGTWIAQNNMHDSTICHQGLAC